MVENIPAAYLIGIKNDVIFKGNIQFHIHLNRTESRKVRTLVEIPRYLLIDSGLDCNLWAEAISNGFTYETDIHQEV